jgi:hypothetical protein
VDIILNDKSYDPAATVGGYNSASQDEEFYNGHKNPNAEESEILLEEPVYIRRPAVPKSSSLYLRRNRSDHSTGINIRNGVPCERWDIQTLMGRRANQA